MQDTSSKPKSLSLAQVAKAVALVNYQDGAVVSREIVKKPTGTVTVFAFDKGEGLSEHTAPFDALVQVLEGEIEIIISGQPYRLQDGEMILMPARTTACAQGAKALQDDSYHDSIVTFKAITPLDGHVP